MYPYTVRPKGDGIPFVIAMFSLTRFATRAAFVSAHILCPGHITCFWKSSETFVVFARRATMLPRFATGRQHRRAQSCRHNVSSFCRGQKSSREKQGIYQLIALISLIGLIGDLNPTCLLSPTQVLRLIETCRKPEMTATNIRDCLAQAWESTEA